MSAVGLKPNRRLAASRIQAVLQRVPRPLYRWAREAIRAGARWSGVVRREPYGLSRPPLDTAHIRLLIGPTNSAGQAYAWSRAVERHIPGVRAQVHAVEGTFAFAADYAVPAPTYRHPAWQRAEERWVLTHASHVLIESLRPLFGTRYGSDCAGDVRVLMRSGISVALVAHGSDVRLPSRHADREPWSPFRHVDDLTRKLERQAGRFAALIAAFTGPVFVSTPDLLVDVPRAHWLPVVVDPDHQAGTEPPLHVRRPVIVHTPSNARLKGSSTIDRVIERLVADDLVEYRRVTGVPAAQMPRLYRSSDIVIDQVLMGLYGVAACEAMAAGRVVVGYVGELVRRAVRDSTGQAVPIVEATPDTLEETLRSVLDNPNLARATAAAGPDFVREVHDGRRSARVLGSWLAPP